MSTAFAYPFLLILAAAPVDSATARPGFEDYAVKEIYRGAPAAPRLDSARAREYRTVLTTGAKQGPNFAGHYTLATWGCGSGCLAMGIIDARTGRVHFEPSVLWVGSVSLRDGGPYRFRADSRLLIVAGCLNDKTNGSFYYEWAGDRLVLRHSEEREGTCLDSK